MTFIEDYNNSEYTNEEIKLIDNINEIDLIYVLRNMKLSLKFVIDYLTNEKYQQTRKEKDITIDTVYCYQEHLRPSINKLFNN